MSVTISHLPPAAALTGDEIVPVVQGGFTVRTTSSDLAALAPGIVIPTPIDKGGTGEITASAAINSLLPSQGGQDGRVLGTNGTNLSWVDQGGGGGAVDSVNSQTGVVVLTAADVGAVATSDLPLAVASGGTGQVTASAALNALLPAQAGQNGKVLTSDGTDAAWVAGGGGGSSNLYYQTSNVVVSPSGTLFNVGSGDPLTDPGSYVINASGFYVNSAVANAILVLDLTIGGGSTFSFMTQALLPALDEGAWYAVITVNVQGGTLYLSTQCSVFSDNDGLLDVHLGGGTDVIGGAVPDSVVLAAHWNVGGDSVELHTSSVQYLVPT